MKIPKKEKPDAKQEALYRKIRILRRMGLPAPEFWYRGVLFNRKNNKINRNSR
jgi:hypothetical protein